MTWKAGQSGNPRGRLTEKVFADALRLAVNQDDPVTGKRKLRGIAEKLVELALAGEGWAIQHVADRLDGKPAQESTVNINDEREQSDWTRAKLVAFLDECRASGGTATKANGRGGEPDSVH